MKTNNYVMIMLSMMAVLFGSCRNDDTGQPSEADAQVRVTVVSNDGEKMPDITVKMYDEKTYPLFEKDNTVKPNLIANTNAEGIATFNLDYHIWLEQAKSSVFMFVVQFGEGPMNYQLWSSGKIIRPGSTENIEIKLTNFPPNN